ncbi:BLOC-1-related complex subunit 6 isoform X2 [Ambystoma mexicanum]|uniref:BLOC-1-related complex subunit 6 isoform X2 n=1 Tax=Ambystoma mexicanum TaxID=8296 RepID=UPI0037E77FAA
MEPSGHHQHVMAEVRVRSGSGGPRGPELNGALPSARASLGRLQDSRSLDGISRACVSGQGKAEPGRRATISSALELEGTVSHEGELTHFTANNLQLRIRLSALQRDLQGLDADHSRSPGLQRNKADIPPIDPGVLTDLERLTQDVAHKVDQMMKSLNCTIQNIKSSENYLHSEQHHICYSVI